MCKFYNAIKCFVFISFSLSLLRADLVLNEKNIQTIENLSKKEIFQKEDVYKCFSLFGFNDSKFHFSETAKEIKQILERGKTDALGYEILANLQKVLAKFLVYDIQHLNIQPVDVDSAETCFQSFNNVLENQAKILIRNTFYKRKEDFFKTFIKNNRLGIVNLSENGEFNEGLVKQCFRLFINEDVDDFTNDQVYKNCINVLVGLIGIEYLNNQSDILFPLQKILKNLLVFYMQQFDELSIKSFCCKFKDLLQGVLGICPEGYKSELKECFYRLLNDSRRVELTPKEEIDSFDKLDKGIYKSKGDCAFALQHFGGAKENLKLLRSASIYLDRFPSSEDSLLNKFIFFSVKKGEGKVVIPQIYCFLSLESRDVDLTAFSICLYNKKSNFSNFGKCEEVFLYPQVEDNKFCFLEEIRVSMLEKVDASRISSSAMLDPSFNALISEDLFRVKKQKFLEINKDNKKSISLDLKTCGEKNIFCGLLWKSCLQEKNAEVQHVLTNYSLGQSKIGDKFLYIKDSINREKQEQQLEIRVHVFATDELLFKALQNFVSQQERQFPEPMFLDYNEKKECFELLSGEQYQSKKKAIFGKLDQKYGVLKQGSENIVNQQRIEELMDALLKQRESDVAELDMDRVRELELLLENEEEIKKLSFAIGEIRAKNEKVMGALGEMQNELRGKMETLKRLRQEVNLLGQENVSRTDLEGNYKVLQQKHVELEERYKQDKSGLNSNAWERLQAQRKKNEEDWEVFQQQEEEHERAWQLYKEEIKQKQETELKRQQEEAERMRKAEEERKRKEEEQRQLAEQQRLERERLEREEAERRRIAEEEQRRREEEARKPKGVTGQQIVDYAVQHSTPQKAVIAKRLVRASKIMPSQLYTNRNQVPATFQLDFDALMSEQN